MHPMLARVRYAAAAFALIVLAALNPRAAYSQAAPGVTFTPLHSFGDPSSDGAAPFGGLIVGPGQDLYGTTSGGGYYNSGMVYKITQSGSETILHDFANSPDGCDPYGQLILGSDGNFYGTANEGGGQTVGENFVMTAAGALTQLVSYNFDAAGFQGDYPRSGLVLGPDAQYYGTLTYNSAGFPNGYVYKMASNGAFTLLHTFTGHPNEGSYPYAPLVLGSDGNFYGTTGRGGGNDLGTVFKMTAAGNLTTLHSFAGGLDGAYPFAGLVQGMDGDLYGLAYAGGANNTGTAFRITSSGTFTLLHNFSADVGNDNAANNNGDSMHFGIGTGNSDGAFPIEALILGSDGNFYGAAECGGKNDTGTIFQLTPSGKLTSLYAFSTDPDGNGNVDGVLPHGSLLEVGKATFYGTTAIGGVNDMGSVYKLSISTATSKLSALILSPATVAAGKTSTATVKIAAAAPFGGEVVALTSSANFATVPSTITIAAGSTSAVFTVKTSTVAPAKTATITAAYDGASKTATLTVNPPELSSIALNPTLLVGGQANSTATVTLTTIAASATTVTLESGNTSVATVPGSVTIAAGASAASFIVTSKAVSASANAIITATSGSVVKTATLTVTPPNPGLKSIKLSPVTAQGGTSTTDNRVFLTGNAITDTTITLKSSNTAVATVPASVTVNSGYSSHLFNVSTQTVTSTQIVTITAISGGVTQKAQLTINPIPVPRAPVAEARFDFNKDGHADLIWYNTQLGDVSVWDMNDTSVLSFGPTFTSLYPSSGWQPVATPDVNGDGYPDLLWWNSQTGAMSVWTLQNTNVVSFYNAFATVIDTTWKPVAAADVTGTTWELVFQNSTSGNIAVWQMNGQAVVSYGATIGSLGAGTGWQIVGTPDLDGDDKSDLLFWNNQTGEVSWWGCDLTQSQVLSYHSAFTQLSDTSWRLVGSEDTNGDGHSDLLWWNAGTGVVSRWLLDGANVTQYGAATTQVTDTTWQPTAIR